MSQAEEDSALGGDYLADLAEQGLITDQTALRYLAGDPWARAEVTKVIFEQEPLGCSDGWEADEYGWDSGYA